MKNVIQRLKVFLKVIAGKEIYIRPDKLYEKERFGSDYGGWDLVTSTIDAKSIVYSFGVGEDATFDSDLIDKFGLTIHAFDPTPKSIDWVKKQGFSDHFVMHSYGLASFDGDASFNPPMNPNHVSHTILDRPTTMSHAISVPFKKLNTIMNELGHDQIDVLKMDIEGAEYEVVEDIRKSEIRPRQILIEFHHRFPGVGIAKTREAIKRIKSMGYYLFSVSPNNKEYGFIRGSG